MGGQKYMVRIIKAGKVYEIIKFPVNGNIKPRLPKTKGSLPRKQDANERAALKRLARLINANFLPGDLLITLTIDEDNKYRIEPDGENGEREKTAHIGKLFLDKLKRQLAKNGVEPKYITVVSDMDGDTGEIVRGHIHLLITAMGFRYENGRLFVGEKDVGKIWGMGSVDVRPLWHQDDFTPIADYLLKQVKGRCGRDKASYSPSRNLAQPELIEERIEYGGGEIKAPRNGKILQRGEYIPGQPQYLRYFVKSAKGPKPVKAVRKRQKRRENGRNGEKTAKSDRNGKIKYNQAKNGAKAGGRK